MSQAHVPERESDRHRWSVRGTKDLVAGYWMIQVKSRDEAIEARRVPIAQLPASDRVPEIELRQLFETTDFPDAPKEVAEMERAFTTSPASSAKGRP